MDNPLARFREFILAPSHSRTISAVVILIIAAAVPLTVLVAQKQQELRQHAVSPGTSCATVGAKSCNGNIPMVCLLTSPPSGKYWEPAGAACTYGCLSTGTCAAAPTTTCVTGIGTSNAGCGGSQYDSYQCTSTTACEQYTYACRGTPATCVKGPHAPVAVSNCPVGSICNPAPTTSSTCTTNGGSCYKYSCPTGYTLISGTCGAMADSACCKPTTTSCPSGQTLISGKCYTNCSGSCQASSSYCGTGSFGPYNSAGNSYCNASTNGGHPYCCNPTTTTTCTAGTGTSNNACGNQPSKYQCQGVSTCEELTWACRSGSCTLGSHAPAAQSLCCGSGKVCSNGACVSTTSTATPKPTTSPTCVTGTGTTNAACGGGAGTTYSCTSTTACEQYTYACRGTPATCVKGPHAPVAVSNCPVGSICNPKTCSPACVSPQVCDGSTGLCGGAPSCGALAASPQSVGVNGTSTLSISCTGTNANTVYKWTSNTCGQIASTTSISTTPWTAPATIAQSPQLCPVNVQVCNGTSCAPGITTITVTLPDCNDGLQPQAACVATISNTCQTNNGTQFSKYTTYNGSTVCNPASVYPPCTVSSCNVGNICTNGSCVGQASPTPTGTPIPGHTMLAFAIGMDAIGQVGDNVNPVSDPNSSNQNPAHTTRNLDVQIFDSNNSQVFAQVGSINYNSGQGFFTGTVDLGANFTNGNYTIKVKSDGHLKRLVPGIQNISSALTQPLQISYVRLVAGDVDSNNALNINDYNILLSCVTSPLIANIDNHTLCNSNANYVRLSDLEDNDVVNEFDYNLFLREYSAQSGD